MKMKKKRKRVKERGSLFDFRTYLIVFFHILSLILSSFFFFFFAHMCFSLF